jgi:hypothetical protein
MPIKKEPPKVGMDHERRIRIICNNSAWPPIAAGRAEIEESRSGPKAAVGGQFAQDALVVSQRRCSWDGVDDFIKHLVSPFFFL